MQSEASFSGRISQVLAEVRAAFGDTSIPDSDAIVAHYHSERDQAGVERIRDALAGKHWNELSHEFLKDNWSSFCYLSATGYRYYLPALLNDCLSNWHDNNDLLHSTVFSLLPSFYYLYFDGRDSEFETQTFTFEPRQYAAVCSFLELAFADDNYKYLAGQALRWGWNRYEHPVHAKVREHYRAFYNYDWPPASEPVVQSLINEIYAVFAGRVYPGDSNLCGSSQGDEPSEYALEFRGQDWRRLHPDFLNRNHACLSFFTDEGFRYYLPAYIIADLHGVLTASDVLFHLTHGIIEQNKVGFSSIDLDLIADEALRSQIQELAARQCALETQFENQSPQYDWHAIAHRKFAAFTDLERKAIVAYLRHRANDEFHRDEAEQALKNYWLPSLSRPPAY